MDRSRARRAPPPEISRGRNVELAYAPGSVLAVDHGVYTHYGIAGDRLVDGEQSVISCSWRCKATVEESLAAFAGGAAVTDKGLIGDLAAHDILLRARADIGRPWHLLRNNCEHHVCRACGLKPRSPQVRRAVAGAAAVAALALVPPLRLALLKGLSSSV